MAENNTPIAEAPAVAAVGEEPVVPAKVEANMERAEAESSATESSATESSATESSAQEAQQNQEHRGNRDRDRDPDSNDDDDRDNRRRNRDGNRDGNRDDRQDAGRMQGPTDLLPELDASAEGEREELPDTRAYEVTYIVLANNEEAQTSTQNRLKEMIEAAGGAVDNARTTESRRLAFPIKKQAVNQTEGIYVVNNARFSQTLIPEMDRFFKLEDNVLRHIILREGR